jgi:predicted enzyme related to lactoylglutathione lyase
MGQPVMHFELWSKTPKKTCDFYRTVFDWRIEPTPMPNYNVVDTQSDMGIGGGIMTPPRPEPWPGNMSFYIAVEDLAAYRTKVVAAGGRILVDEQDVPDKGSFSLFSDPDGRVVGLWKPKGSH